MNACGSIAVNGAGVDGVADLLSVTFTIVFGLAVDMLQVILHLIVQIIHLLLQIVQLALVALD